MGTTKTFLAFFTEDGAPKTGLTPTIRIRRLDTDALVVTDAAMSEVGDGFYKYIWNSYDQTRDYSARCDAGSSLEDFERYVYAGSEDFGITDKLNDKFPTNNIMGSSVKTDKDDEIDSILLDTGAIKTKTDQLGFSISGNVNANVEEIDPTVQGNLVDDVWDEPMAGHVTVDTSGEYQNKIPTIETNTEDIEDKVDIIDSNVDAIKTKTDNLAFDGSGNVHANVQAAGVLNDLSSADVQLVIENNDLDHLVKVAPVTPFPTSLTFIDQIMNKDNGQTFDRDTDSLEALSDAPFKGPQPESIASAVWDTTASVHNSPGTFGSKNQNLVPSETITDYRADVSALALEVTAQGIKIKTDNLPADPTAESIATSNKNEIIAEVDANEVKIDAIQADITTIDGKVDVIDGNVDAIKIKTDQLTFTGANVNANVQDKGVLNDPSAADIDTQLSGTHGAGNWEYDQDPVIDFDVLSPAIVDLFAFKPQDSEIRITVWDKTGNKILGLSNVVNPGLYAVSRSRGGESEFVQSGSLVASVYKDQLVFTFNLDLNGSLYYPGDTVLLIIDGIELLVDGVTHHIPLFGRVVATIGDAIAAQGTVVTGSTTTSVTVNIESHEDNAFNGMQLQVERPKISSIPGYWVNRNIKKSTRSGINTIFELDEPLPFTPVVDEFAIVKASGSSYGNKDDLLRILGLLHENIWVNNTWAGDLHTGSVIELYNSKINAENHDGATGLIAKYTLTVEYTGNRAQTQLNVKED